MGIGIHYQFQWWTSRLLVALCLWQITPRSDVIITIQFNIDHSTREAIDHQLGSTLLIVLQCVQPGGAITTKHWLLRRKINIIGLCRKTFHGHSYRSLLRLLFRPSMVKVLFRFLNTSKICIKIWTNFLILNPLSAIVHYTVHGDLTFL